MQEHYVQNKFNPKARWWENIKIWGIYTGFMEGANIPNIMKKKKG